MAAQPVRVARELPVKIGLDDLTHLSVGGGIAKPIFAVRQHLAETHSALLVLRIAESGLAQRMSQRRKNKLGGCFVVPDVGAVAEAAAAMIVAAFEAVELAIGRAEGSLGDERG